MSDKHVKHLHPEHEETFTSSVMNAGDFFLNIAEKENLCAVCFLTYFYIFVIDAILKEAPHKSNEIFLGMQQAASRVIGAEVSFIVERSAPTTVMESVIDAFSKEISASKKGKLN